MSSLLVLIMYSPVTLVISHIRLTSRLYPGDKQNHHKISALFLLQSRTETPLINQTVDLQDNSLGRYGISSHYTFLLNQWLSQMGCLQVHCEAERVGTKVLAIGTNTSWKDRIFHLSIDDMKAEFPWDNKESLSNLDLQISMSELFVRLFLYCGVFFLFVFGGFFECSLLLVSCLL